MSYTHVTNCARQTPAYLPYCECEIVRVLSDNYIVIIYCPPRGSVNVRTPPRGSDTWTSGVIRISERGAGISLPSPPLPPLPSTPLPFPPLLFPSLLSPPFPLPPLRSRAP